MWSGMLYVCDGWVNGWGGGRTPVHHKHSCSDHTQTTPTPPNNNTQHVAHTTTTQQPHTQHTTHTTTHGDSPVCPEVSLSALAWVSSVLLQTAKSPSLPWLSLEHKKHGETPNTITSTEVVWTFSQMHRQTADSRLAYRKRAVRNAHEETSKPIAGFEANRVKKADGSPAIWFLDKGALQAAKSTVAPGDSDGGRNEGRPTAASPTPAQLDERRSAQGKHQKRTSLDQCVQH